MDRTPEDDRLLIELLRLASRPCPLCGRELAALETPRCPGCGVGVRLQLGSEDLRLGAWLTAVFGVALALGFCGLMSVLAATLLIVRGEPRPMVLFLAVFTPLATVFAAALWGLVRWRRRLWQRPPARQWALAAVVLAGILLLLVAAVTYLTIRR